MIWPNFKEERKLTKRGFNFIVGLDEAGRGPLAGPVVAGAVTFTVAKFKINTLCHPEHIRSAQYKLREGSRRFFGLRPQNDNLYCFRNIRDSKKLSPKQREKWYKILTGDKNIKWGVGVVSHKIIDEINILEASKLAMKKALVNLAIEPDFLLLDGNFLLEDLNISQKAIISGDEKIISIAAASIIAKVTRDRLMRKYHQKFPVYGFDQHKGYGTKKHFETLKKYGPCALHRFSFRPVRGMANK